MSRIGQLSAATGSRIIASVRGPSDLGSSPGLPGVPSPSTVPDPNVLMSITTAPSLTARNPATGEELGQVPVTPPAAVAGIVARARTAQTGLASHTLERTPRPPAPLVGDPGPGRRRLGRRPAGRGRQAGRRGDGRRGRADPRRPAVDGSQRGTGAGWIADRAGLAALAADAAGSAGMAADRCRRRHRDLELPAVPDRPGAGPGARGGQRRGVEAIGAGPARRPAAPGQSGGGRIPGRAGGRRAGRAGGRSGAGRHHPSTRDTSPAASRTADESCRPWQAVAFRRWRNFPGSTRRSSCPMLRSKPTARALAWAAFSQRGADLRRGQARLRCRAATRMPSAGPSGSPTEARSLRVGDPAAGDVEVGPLITEAARDRFDGQVRAAIAAGAQVLAGGAPWPGPGAFYAPTVLIADPENESRLNRPWPAASGRWCWYAPCPMPTGPSPLPTPASSGCRRASGDAIVVPREPSRGGSRPGPSRSTTPLRPRPARPLRSAGSRLAASVGFTACSACVSSPVHRSFSTVAPAGFAPSFSRIPAAPSTTAMRAYRRLFHPRGH